MKIITVTNQKGGTGKTSITMNLGVALALTGKKILLEEKRPATIGFKALIWVSQHSQEFLG